MKKTIYQLCEISFYFGIISVFLTACNKPQAAWTDKLIQPSEAPKTVPINVNEGYAINQLTGDSVPGLINSLGDTVRSGKLLIAKGISISSDSLPLPKKIVTGIPDKIPVHTNVTAIPDNLIKREVEILKQYVPTGSKASSFVLVNSRGDTLPTNQPVRSGKGKIMPCVRYPSKPSLSPGTKDNALYNISYLDIEQGLDASSALAMLQDSRGNIWIGLDGGGLCRYDGSSFTNYKIYGGEFVRFIYEDLQQNIWYGGPDGLVCYNGKTFRVFTEEEGMSSNQVTDILQDKDGAYWMSTMGGGLVRYEIIPGDSIGEFTYLTTKEGLPSNIINSLMLDSKARLWICTRNAGVCYLDLNEYKRKQKFLFGYLDEKTGLSHNNAQSVIEDKYNNYWISTMNGLNYYELPTNEKKETITMFTKEMGLPSDILFPLLEDSDGNIWIGTFNGLVILNRGNQTNFAGARFIHFGEDEGLSYKDAVALIQDRNGNVWCGTNGGGINCFTKGSFSYLNKKNGLPENKITALQESKDGSLWIAPIGYLVHYKSPDPWTQGTFTIYGEKQGLIKPLIRDIAEDKDGNLWLGTNIGLIKFEPSLTNGPGAYTQYTSSQGLNQNIIRTVLVDKQGNIWIGTNGAGLRCFTFNDKDGTPKYVITQYTDKEGLPSNIIKDITEDEQGILWLTTRGGGIVRFQPPTEDEPGTFFIYTEKEGLPMNYTAGFYVDEQDPNHLWLGTDKGVCYFEKTKDNFLNTITYYSDKQGITDNWTWSIFGRNNSGERSTLWIAAWMGINILEINQQNNRVFQLDMADGLRGTRNIIWDKASLKDQKNRIWWGRNEGLEMLDLNDFKLTDAIPQPQLHDLDINGASFDFWNASDSAKKGIVYNLVTPFENYPQNFKLAYNKNHLTFHFSAMDWSAPHKVRYSYIMDGLNEAWTEPSSETKAEYRNLPSGTHTFKVRAIGESQKWSEPFEYTFTIRPPWWYSWWAFVIYSCLGGFILYRSYRFQLDRKLEIAERKRLVEMDRIKNRLYTNITHEFRTPLTLIHGPVSQALSKNTNLDKKDIQSIHRQSERLQELINQMLELQKLEAGMLKPNYSYGEVIQMLRYLFGSFETWAGEKNISMIFSSSLQEVYMDVDKEKLTQIITNLVNNAIKHTPRNGKVAISVNASARGEFLLVQVSDNGTGISEEDLPFIFDRFYQSKRAAVGGTGIGLAIVKNLAELLGGSITVQSKLDEGTTFILKLPITKHAPKASELFKSALPIAHEMEDEETHFATIESLHPGKPIVLVIEDHPEVSQYIVSCLAQEYNTLTAMNGDAGLQTALEKVPDLIISDVMMPGKDGFELTRMLKKDIQTSHIPIILLTGRGDHEAMMTGIEHGADAYVIKPFDPTELVLRVKKLLELRADLSLHYRQHATAKEIEPTKEASPRENEFLKNMRLFIEAHMNDSQFNMDMLSRHMAMSHPQLHRKITALTGQSVGRFVRSMRLTKAKELLKNSDLTISEIAYETGFSEPGYFTKVFSKEFNTTPTEYRSNPI